MELRTPLGNRDRLAGDVRKRNALCSRIQKVFDQFGFEEVQTPAIEYYQTYNQAFAALQDRQMLKMIDENQDILTLRMDMTVPIARMAATSLKNAQAPLRLSYLSDFWKVRKALTGRQAQSMDCGVELIGSQDDTEILVCALEALRSCGVENYRLELSDARLLEDAAACVFEREEDVLKLADLCDRKSMVELEEFLDSFELDEAVRRYFLSLPLMDGGMEVIRQAKELAFDAKTLDVLEELEALGDFLVELGYEEVIGFDLGKLPHLNYYTGLIFEAFVPGASGSVLSGGRYDSLMASFGRPLPAVGFAFKIEPLAALFKELDERSNLVIRYPKSKAIAAFELARARRMEGSVKMIIDDSIDEIIEEREVRP